MMLLSQLLAMSMLASGHLTAAFSTPNSIRLPSPLFNSYNIQSHSSKYHGSTSLVANPSHYGTSSSTLSMSSTSDGDGSGQSNTKNSKQVGKKRRFLQQAHPKAPQLATVVSPTKLSKVANANNPNSVNGNNTSSDAPKVTMHEELRPFNHPSLLKN
eukprot:g14991.t1 g14991   contig21:301055-301525(-)